MWLLDSRLFKCQLPGGEINLICVFLSLAKIESGSQLRGDFGLCHIEASVFM